MWWSKVVNVFRGSRVSQDIERELAFHIAEREDELVSGGMAREAARREAQRRFGHAPSLGEATRDADLALWLDTAWRDVRYAARGLRASRGFTLVAILSLALGIGANTAIFSLINAVMLRDLPVKDPQELVVVSMSEDRISEVTNPLWEQIRDGSHPFASVLAYGGMQVNLTDIGEERPADGLWVSGSFFSTLGVGASRGRVLTAGDDVPGCPAMTVVSHGFWQSQLGADPAVVGRTIAFSGKQIEIIGVADPRFTGLEAGRAPAFYIPLCAQPVLSPESGFLQHRSLWFLRVLARLAPPTTLAQANEMLRPASAAWFSNTLPANWSAENQKSYLDNTFHAAESLGELSGLRGTYSGALMVLMAIVAVVLLVACANVANLMLVRAEARQRELAVRVALGAGRGRVVRLLFTEGLLLSIAGATLGIGFAYQGSRLLVRFLETSRDRVFLDLGVDGRVLAFTAGTAVLTALLFGLAPAWRALRIDPQDALKAGGRGVVEARTRFGVGKSLVVAQVALSLMLVTSAALLLGSFRAVAGVDKGFETGGLLIAEANLRWSGLAPEARVELQRQTLARLRAIPGVTAASASWRTPLAPSTWNDEVQAPGVTFAKPEDGMVWVNLIWDGYFSTLGMRLLAGRDYGAVDRAGAAKVAIINETAAKRLFPSRSPVGGTFKIARGNGTSQSFEVVGVVSDAAYRSIREPAAMQLFLPMAQDLEYNSGVEFTLRSPGPPMALRTAVIAALAEMAPRATVSFRELEVQVRDTIRTDRLLATLSLFFGGLALLLAMIGLYGTMSYSVARRRGEIGVRLALGAAPSQVSSGVLGEVTRVLALGSILGLAGVFATTRLVEGFLFGVTPREPFILVGSVLLLGAATLAAGYLPARRASRLNPLEALRQE